MENDSKYCGCLLFSANALSRVITKMAEEEFSVTGLAPSHAFLLMTVNDKKGIQPKELSMVMMLKPSTITRLIEKMEQKGFLVRKPEGKNTLVYPTQKSLDLNPKIHDAWQNLYKRYAKLLGEANSKMLTSEIYKSAKILSE